MKYKTIELQREECNRQELVERMAQAIPADGKTEPLPGLELFRTSVTTQSMHGTAEPAFCAIAQGSKEVLLGERRYAYDPYSYLLPTLSLPVVGRVVMASPERPYLALRLRLD